MSCLASVHQRCFILTWWPIPSMTDCEATHIAHRHRDGGTHPCETQCCGDGGGSPCWISTRRRAQINPLQALGTITARSTASPAVSGPALYKEKGLHKGLGETQGIGALSTYPFVSGTWLTPCRSASCRFRLQPPVFNAVSHQEKGEGTPCSGLPVMALATRAPIALNPAARFFNPWLPLPALLQSAPIH